MVEKGSNPLRLENFAAFLESGGLSKLSQSINDNYQKHNEYFNKIVYHIINCLVGCNII